MSTTTLRPTKFLTSMFALALAAGGVVESHAVSGPEYRSLRALSMGNAFVAVVDNKDALYYNPAGLNLINALGNPSARPGLAAYPRTRLNARVNAVGMAVPLETMNDFFTFYKNHKEAFKGDDSAFRADETFFEDLNPLDRQAIDFSYMNGIEFAMHNYGGAVWVDAQAAPYADVGILIPQAGIETIQLDAVAQVAAARGFLNNRLAAGVGYRLANRQIVKDFQVSTTDLATDGGKPVQDQVLDTLDAKFSNFSDISSWGHGIDLGALWQQTSWLRFGASVQNLGMYLNNEFVTPEFTVGAAITPPLLSSGGAFPRKVNIGVDFEDMFNSERNYKLFNKINFGAEVEQYLWWFASARVAGGFKGGYWTGGLGLGLFTAVHIEAASWAEEAGVYTGQIEDRYWAFRVGIGI